MHYPRPATSRTSTLIFWCSLDLRDHFLEILTWLLMAVTTIGPMTWRGERVNTSNKHLETVKKNLKNIYIYINGHNGNNRKMGRGESFPFILAPLSAPLSQWNLYKIRSSEREANDEWENEQTSTQLIWNSLFPIVSSVGLSDFGLVIKILYCFQSFRFLDEFFSLFFLN